MRKPVQAVIKLTCAYFTPERCVLGFEMNNVYCKEGEPKEEWVSTPPNESDEVVVFPEHM